MVPNIIQCRCHIYFAQDDAARQRLNTELEMDHVRPDSRTIYRSNPCRYHQAPVLATRMNTHLLAINFSFCSESQGALFLRITGVPYSCIIFLAAATWSGSDPLIIDFSSQAIMPMLKTQVHLSSNEEGGSVVFQTRQFIHGVDGRVDGRVDVRQSRNLMQGGAIEFLDFVCNVVQI